MPAVLPEGEGESMFRLLFERSTDPIWLFEPKAGVFVDCNQAAVELMRSGTREKLLQTRPDEVSPPYQPDGRTSAEAAAAIIGLIESQGGHRFEWLARRTDGTEVPLEVVSTQIVLKNRTLHVVVSRDISERKSAEARIRQLNQELEDRVAERTAALTASEARLRTLVENAPEAIVVFDGETGRFEVVNENAARLFGRCREELLRLTPSEVSPPFQPDGRPSREAARERIQEALAGGTPVFDWLHQHPSGRLFVCEVRLVRLPSEGRPLVRASILDTTERRRREQTQRAVYEISEAVHDAADLPSLYARIHGIVGGLMPAENFYIALFDPVTEVITFPYFVDEQATEMPQPRKVGTGLTGVVLRTGKPLLANREFTEESRREGESLVLDRLGGISYKESGTPAAVWLGVPLTIQGTPIGVMAVQDYRNEAAYDEEEKQILTFVGVQTAVAIERKRAEEALLEQVQKNRALFDASSHGVMLQDEKQFLDANPAAVRILRRQRAHQVIGRHPRDFAPPLQPNGEPSDEMAARYIAECLDKGSVRFEWTLLGPDGQLIPADVLLTRVHWGDQWIIQAIVEDITERKRAEEELLKSLAHEKELNHLKTSFVSTVSHEFRTPLGIILSSAQILADYFERLDAEERREHLLSIAKNTRQMSSLMEEVLVLSRADSGKMVCQRAPLDLAALCHRLADEVASATGGQCPIELEVAPECAATEADERLLRHIFTNLLSNAVKYSPPGSAVRFTVRRENGDAICRIRDHGIGIPEADRPWLFHAFHRGRNVGDRPGTGLGLTIVKRCVELHGGRISLQSESGQGTVVTVRIPLFKEAGNGRTET
jgi:PAS domain S-box-containing protein